MALLDRHLEGEWKMFHLRGKEVLSPI